MGWLVDVEENRSTTDFEEADAIGSCAVRRFKH
jgi:hypothetical protein